MIKKPKTVEEYVELVNQAVYEVEELRMAMEYDEDSLGGAASFLDELERGVLGLKREMAEGSYRWASGDLPFMGIVENVDDRLLPFKDLLRLINHTHMTGLEVDEGP